MPTQKDILKVIAEHLSLNTDDLDIHADLRDELGLGPVELNDLLSHLSIKFGVSFQTEDVEDLKNLNDLVSLVEDNLLD